MTYGRPSMTSHISPASPPVMKPESHSDDPCALSGQPCDHISGYMTFYVSTIELYKILEAILSDIYNAWQSRSNQNRPLSYRGMRHSSLDVIMELDDKLSTYEANIPTVLNWTSMHPPLSPNSHEDPIFKRQRNVLRARYFHLLAKQPAIILTSPDSSIFAFSFIVRCSHNSAPTTGSASPGKPGQIQTRARWD